ncbi:hypothetical protein ACFL5M_01465 [Candidatus Neomarinimicrobiota bacterium]
MFTRQITVILLFLATTLPAQTSRIDTARSRLPDVPASHYPITGRPPVTIPRIVTEWAAAFILAHYGGSIGSNLAVPRYVSDPYGSLSDRRILAGIVSGTQIGSLIGVKVVASEANITASIPATLAGGLAGFALGAAATNYTGNPEYLFAGSATGSVIGFNLTRRYLPIDPTRPDLPNRQFLAQVATSMVGGYLGMFTAGYLTTLKPAYQDCDEGWCPLEPIFNAFLYGMPVGCTLGAWLTGSIGPKTGSLLATGLGCMAGWVITVPAVLSGLLPWWTLPVFPSCGAVVGFNLTRHYKKDRAPTAAITVIPYLALQHGTPLLGVRLTLP